MRKLLSGNFARLWKSRVFWVLQGFSFGFGVFAYALVAIWDRDGWNMKPTVIFISGYFTLR